ncbi:MAG: hypothetical protein ACXW29_09450 [Thermoanaerobaculia bacterium]
MRKTLVVVALIALMVACNGQRGPQTSTQTDTITPAPPKPAPATDTEAMTQTVDVEDSRTDAEGGVPTAKKTDTSTVAKKRPVTKAKAPGRAQ